MPFSVKPIEETIAQVEQQVSDINIEKFTNSEKFDVLFVIMIVLLMFAFSRFTAVIFKLIGAVIIGLGVYTLFLT